MPEFHKILDPLKKVWPWLVSQTEASSDAYVQQAEKLAVVEAKKSFLLKEAASIAGVRNSMRNKMMEASPEERIALRRDIRSAEEELRLLGITQIALGKFAEYEDSPKLLAGPESNTKKQTSVTEHWIDKFEQLARSVNETWREELLAYALAKEASSPGSISVRALWTLGTIEKRAFDAFEVLLGYCSSIEGEAIIISGCSDYDSEVYRKHSESLDQIYWQLNETGLIALNGTSFPLRAVISCATYHKDSDFTLHRQDQELEIHGHGPSVLGQEIAQICAAPTLDEGVDLLHWFLRTAASFNYIVTKHCPDFLISCAKEAKHKKI